MSFNFKTSDNNENKINKSNDLDASHVLNLALQQIDGIIAGNYRLIYIKS